MSQPTILQCDFVRDLQRQLHLPANTLDIHCERRFGVRFAAIDIRQCSALIEELKSWKAIPADLQRAVGQMDLFEVRS